MCILYFPENKRTVVVFIASKEAIIDFSQTSMWGDGFQGRILLRQRTPRSVLEIIHFIKPTYEIPLG